MSAEIFLHLLDPNANKFCFLAYPEGGSSIRPQQMEGRYGELRASLTEMNESGCTIAVCINKTDGSGRKRENIVRVRAVWHDDDAGYRGEFPLEPSLIVQTSPGRFHRYWFVADDWPTDVHGAADFRSVMQTMVRLYGADGQAKDLSRTMRLPGFYHLKEEPHLVTIIGGNSRRYPRAMLLEHFRSSESSNQNGSVSGAIKVKDIAVEPDDYEETNKEELIKARNALDYIEPDSRKHWLDAGMALHNRFDGCEEAYELWDNWSKNTKANNYNEGDQRRTWTGLSSNHPNPITIASLYSLARENGWTDIPPLAELPEHRINISRKDGDLVSKTLADIRRQFEQYRHHPSEQHFDGLEQVAAAIQAMAEESPDIGNSFYISFLPPGTGKTSTATAAIRNLLRMNDHAKVGVIVFLARVDEIRSLAGAMGLSEEEYSVIVSDGYKEGDLGNPNKTDARVLFTTQQMLLSRLRRHHTFNAISNFHWNGSPRQVRIWDEAILPAQFVTLDYYGIANLLKNALREGGKEFADDIQLAMSRLETAKNKQIIQLPDIRSHGLNLTDVQSWYDSPGDKENCEALFRLSGMKVRVRKDIANSALHYESILADDLGPMLILDASGQCRKVYEFWHRHRGNLFALPSPQKSYDGLTIHHWNRGAGQKARRDDGQDLVEGVVKTIRSIPNDEPILVIHRKRKSQKEPDWEQDIRSHFYRNEHIHFCNWGRHTATNDYQQCKHVILLGVLQYATSQYEAIARGAKGIDVEEELSDADLRATQLGEVAHNIFQAACRGLVRKSEGDGCPSGTHLYVIYSSRKGTGIPRELLAQLFPGAAIEDWRPIFKLSGRVKELWELLTGMTPGIPIEKEDLRQKLGMKHVQQLNKLLTHRGVRGTIEQEGSELVVERGTVTLHRAPQKMLDLDKLYPF